MKFLPKIIAIALFTAPTASLAHDYTLGDLIVMHPTARETIATAMAGAGYLMITNNGQTPEVLIGVEADFPRVMMHETIMDGDVAQMIHVDEIQIAPGETVTFEPGGMHVMFMGLKGDPFEVGEKIPATLIFENAGRLDIEFNVEAMSEASDHSDH